MARPGKDYTGMKFGKLTVIERSDKQDKRGNILWHCKCECGNDYYCIGSKLVDKRSCGCICKPFNIKEYIGRQFYDWFIIEPLKKTDKGWEVRCQCILCGNVKDNVNIYNIISGRSKNCGCGRKQTLAKIRRKHTVESLQNQKFGRLTVVREYGRNKYGKILYECKCDCGGSRIVLGNSLIMGTVRSCGCVRYIWNQKMEEIVKELGYECILEKPIKTNDIKCRLIRFDLYIPELNLAIEYDGEYHFMPIDFGNQGKEAAEKSYRQVVFRDKFKNKYCEENGIHLLRIPYTERDNMKELIINKINTITKK